jgi:beta-glucanase (GH16 family)
MSGTTGTVQTIATLLQDFADNQPPHSIIPRYLRDAAVTLQALMGVASVNGKSGPVTLTAADIGDYAASVLPALGSVSGPSGRQYTGLAATDRVLVRVGGVIGWLPYSALAALIPGSPELTVVAAVGPTITDVLGNTWGINLQSQVAVNGNADTASSNVIQLAYVRGKIWYENRSFLWFYKTLPTDSWLPAGGTAVSPFASPDKTVVTSVGPIITDNAGNSYSLSSGGQVVINGAGDSTSSNAVQLDWVASTLWYMNSSWLWFGKSGPAAAWTPASGRLAAPIPSADRTVVTTVGPVITDNNYNTWSINSAGQVVVNGTPDTAHTANVIELAYVSGQVWQENNQSLWWAKTLPTDAWAPAAGTTTSPLAGATQAPTGSGGTTGQGSGSPAGGTPSGAGTTAGGTTTIPAVGVTPGLLWSDEFNTLSLYNPANASAGGNWYAGGAWRGGQDQGTVNNDSYEMTPLNPATPFTVYAVANSILSIQFIITPSQYAAACQNKPYTTGTMNTSNSFNRQYGYVEIRAKVPSVPGVGGAFWFMPSDGSWPPEIDGPEFVTLNSGPIQAHGVAIIGNSSAPQQDPSNGGTFFTVPQDGNFHTFAVDWQSTYIRHYFDGTLMTSSDCPAQLQRPMYFIIEVHGGDPTPGVWGNGPVTDTSLLPATWQVDYVRWWDTMAHAAVGIPASGNGASLTGTSGSIVDSNGVTWTLVPGSQGLSPARNGTIDTSAWNVILLYWCNGTMYQENSAGNWYFYTSNGWALYTPSYTTPVSTRSWNKTTISWGFGTPTSLNSAVFGVSYSHQITDPTQVAQITAAIDIWQAVSGLTLTFVSDATNADIQVGYYDTSTISLIGECITYWDGNNHFIQNCVLLQDPAVAGYALSYDSIGMLAYPDTVELGQCAAHEFVEGLGLAEGTDPASISNHVLSSTNRVPDVADVIAIQSLFGKPA